MVVRQHTAPIWLKAIERERKAEQSIKEQVSDEKTNPEIPVVRTNPNMQAVRTTGPLQLEETVHIVSVTPILVKMMPLTHRKTIEFYQRQYLHAQFELNGLHYKFVKVFAKEQEPWKIMATARLIGTANG